RLAVRGRGASPGWRRGAPGRAGGNGRAAWQEEARQERPCGCAAPARAADGRSATAVVDPARSHLGLARARAAAAHAWRAAHGVAAADPGGALPPRLPAAPRADGR